jgi:hypothetical protein
MLSESARAASTIPTAARADLSASGAEAAKSGSALAVYAQGAWRDTR